MTISPATFFSKRWRWATVAVVLGTIFLARLGFWQLDRLEWRRGLNEATAAELAQPPMSLNGDLTGLDLSTMVNRQVTAVGEYDYDHEFVILAQSFNGTPGKYLVTPLLLEGSTKAVFVNRGLVPESETDFTPYRVEGPVEVFGYIQASETLSGGRQTEVTDDLTLYRIDVGAMNTLLPYGVLPIFVLEPPASTPDLEIPFQTEPDLSLSEGSHLSYAIQWFSFAILLVVIYGVFVNRSEKPTQGGDHPAE